MKRKDFSKKLVLNKKTIVNLKTRDLKHIYGGASEETYCFTDCRTKCATNCVTCEPTTSRIC
jgi:hypothetical protein